MAQTIQLGTIVWADVSEPNGRPVGPHRAIVVSRQEDIDSGADLQLVVCSTSFSLPLRSGWFDVPTMPGPSGHPVTGLKEACVAKATWLQIVPAASIISIAGRAPMSLCRQIISWLNQENANRIFREQ